MRSHQIVSAIFLCLTLTLIASAHEFWIRPDTFAAKPDAVGRFYLMHGHRFNGECVYRNEPYIERFEVVTDDGIQKVLGRHGQPTNAAKLTSSGTNVVVYESREVLSVLPPERFAAYLDEQGLEHIAQEREQRGETQDDGAEVYVRCAKSLVTVSDQSTSESAGLVDRAVGLPLEIVLDAIENPTAGQNIRARVLYEGRPLAQARVVAVAEARRDEPTVLHTDADGYVTIEIDSAGPWMLTSLHMIRLEAREDADWKSFWASVTFALSPASAINSGP